MFAVFVIIAGVILAIFIIVSVLECVLHILVEAGRELAEPEREVQKTPLEF